MGCVSKSFEFQSGFIIWIPITVSSKGWQNGVSEGGSEILVLTSCCTKARHSV